MVEWRMPAGKPVSLSAEERDSLVRIVAARTSAQRDVLRARIVLGVAANRSNQAVASELKTSVRTVTLWRGRWSRQGLAGLRDAPGRGRKRRLEKAKLEQVLQVSKTPNPEGGPWSTRAMARATGLSHMTVARLWRAHDLKPHLTRGFKLSKDENFDAKFWDVVGLYLQPPEKAVVLCCDEKSQCQALEPQPTRSALGHGPYRHSDARL